MHREQLKQKTWYWVRRDDGQIVPYIFHRTRWDARTRCIVADFYVGSLLRSWPLGRVMGEAQMPVRS